MNLSRMGPITAVAVLGLALGSAPSHAAGDPAGNGGPAAVHRGKSFDPATRIEARLSRLKTELKITPAQEAAWQAYADSITQTIESMRSAREAMMQARGAQTAPELMHQRVAFMKERLPQVEAISDALDHLYGVLTPEQRAALDHHFARMRAKWRHGRS